MPAFLAGRLESDLLWILPAPTVPWIRRHYGVIKLAMGAHDSAMRPTLPLALRFWFRESQHFRLWSWRLG